MVPVWDNAYKRWVIRVIRVIMVIRLIRLIRLIRTPDKGSRYMPSIAILPLFTCDCVLFWL